jgi:GNAT superfamily N-acetyltransferase
VRLPTVEIRPGGFDEAAVLFAELDLDLGRRYGDGEAVHVSRSDFDAPQGRLLVATCGEPGRLVGWAGVRALPDRLGVAELKRMFVRPDARHRGVARALLTACEQAAAHLGYSALWLETGLRQPEAVALYRSAGYTEVVRFGQFRDQPESVYLGRELTG